MANDYGLSHDRQAKIKENYLFSQFAYCRYGLEIFIEDVPGQYLEKFIIPRSRRV